MAVTKYMASNNKTGDYGIQQLSELLGNDLAFPWRIFCLQSIGICDIRLQEIFNANR